MDFIRGAQTESEKATGKLDIGIVPDRDLSAFQRNEFTFFCEDFGSPWTPEEAARHRAFILQQQRPSARIRRRYRKIKWRLGDTWRVLRHGLPERDWQ